jgi:hypothetical protein
MRLLPPLFRRLTALASIALMLAGVATSGHAAAAHIAGLSQTAPSQPCHHALATDTMAPARAGTLDLCREMCLSKLPDTAISASGVQFVAVAPVSTPAPVVMLAAAAALRTAPPEVPASAPTPPDLLRRAVYLATQRLLI